MPNIRPEETTAPASPPTSPPSESRSCGGRGRSDGEALEPEHYEGSRGAKTGIFALEKADLFNLLCIPPATRRRRH